jgi:glutamine amidotransferase
MPTAAIINYEVGNLFSIECGLKKVGFHTEIISSPLQLNNKDAVVLPGVGSFSAAANQLEPYRQKILDLVKNGTPLLGICLGMQLFFSSSEEGNGKGLNVFRGRVAALPRSVKIPHMGWNTLHIVKENEILQSIEDDSFVYFVHSFYPIPKKSNIVIADTAYGTTFATVLAENNVFGTQFHPEKSGEKGLVILANFARFVKR